MGNTTRLAELKKIKKQLNDLLNNLDEQDKELDKAYKKEMKDLSGTDCGWIVEFRLMDQKGKICKKLLAKLEERHHVYTEKKKYIREKRCDAQRNFYGAGLEITALEWPITRNAWDKRREVYIKYVEICDEAGLEPEVDLHKQYRYAFILYDDWVFKSSKYPVEVLIRRCDPQRDEPRRGGPKIEIWICDKRKSYDYRPLILKLTAQNDEDFTYVKNWLIKNNT